MRKIGYCRTSTSDQVAGIEKQSQDLAAHGCAIVFKEHVSEINDSRPEFEKALKELKAGDTLVINNNKSSMQAHIRPGGYTAGTRGTWGWLRDS